MSDETEFNEHRHCTVGVKVGGDLACFTRPEMKVERFTYEVMTPSAANGILESILWKPEIKWIVDEIQVLRPIEFFSITRNEIKKRQIPNRPPINVEDERTQRNTVGLRNVEYIIKAHVALKNQVTDLDTNELALPQKYQGMFWKRVKRGMHRSQPYLGCKEFAVGKIAPPTGDEQPIKLTKALGSMLHHINYNDDGTGTPKFFDAVLRNGVMKC